MTFGSYCALSVLQVSSRCHPKVFLQVIGPCSGNPAAATLTPPPSPPTSSSPQGQRSAPSRLYAPILSPDSSPSPPSIMPPALTRLPHTSTGPGLRPPITARQAASPNGVRCQSAQWLPLKPRETPAPLLFCLFLSVPPFWLLTPSSEQRWTYRTTWMENDFSSKLTPKKLSEINEKDSVKWVYEFRDVHYENRLMCIKVHWCNQNPIRFKGKILLLTT